MLLLWLVLMCKIFYAIEWHMSCQVFTVLVVLSANLLNLAIPPYYIILYTRLQITSQVHVYCYMYIVLNLIYNITHLNFLCVCVCLFVCLADQPT